MNESRVVPHVDVLAIPTRVYNPDIFVVCFTVGEPVRQIVCLVSWLFPVCLVKVMVRSMLYNKSFDKVVVVFGFALLTWICTKRKETYLILYRT